MLGRIAAAVFEAEGFLCCGCTEFDGTFVLVSTCDIVRPLPFLSTSGLLGLTGLAVVLRAMKIRCKQGGSTIFNAIFLIKEVELNISHL
jgi:hypothetical protein